MLRRTACAGRHHWAGKAQTGTQVLTPHEALVLQAAALTNKDWYVSKHTGASLARCADPGSETFRVGRGPTGGRCSVAVTPGRGAAVSAPARAPDGDPVAAAALEDQNHKGQELSGHDDLLDLFVPAHTRPVTSSRC